MMRALCLAPQYRCLLSRARLRVINIRDAPTLLAHARHRYRRHDAQHIRYAPIYHYATQRQTATSASNSAIIRRIPGVSAPRHALMPKPQRRTRRALRRVTCAAPLRC
jgi:hypothetical protein